MPGLQSIVDQGFAEKCNLVFISSRLSEYRERSHISRRSKTALRVATWNYNDDRLSPAGEVGNALRTNRRKVLFREGATDGDGDDGD